MSTPVNGTIVKCADCGMHHRLTTPKNKFTGMLAVPMLGYLCNNFLQIGWDGKKLLNSLEIVHSFGDGDEEDEFLHVDPEFEI